MIPRGIATWTFRLGWRGGGQAEARSRPDRRGDRTR